jgi:hypothetical protein
MKKKRRRGGRGRGHKPGLPGAEGMPQQAGQLPQQPGTPAPAVVPVTSPQPTVAPSSPPPPSQASAPPRVTDENKGNVKPSEAPTEVDGNR